MSKKNICLSVPFSSPEYAKLAYNVLIVDKDHKRSEVSKELDAEGKTLKVTFHGNDLKRLRVAVNSILKNILLIVKTIDMYEI